jgi:hypothetical protein
VVNRQDSDEDFRNPLEACDIIMKGGITSGVVYPLAVVELAKLYRLANIGGTSAGAIAAAAAAAAEYGRYVSGRGFMHLAGLPQEIGPILFSLFQPAPKLAPLFQILVAALKGKTAAGKAVSIGWAALVGFRWLALLGAIIAAIITFVLSQFAETGLAFGILLGILGMFVGVLFGLKTTLTKHLPANNYGICSGIRQPGFRGPAFTDWLADVIDLTAGRDPTRDPPLTFGDLGSPSRDRAPIVLRMMTTNLMLRRPHTLPFQDDIYTFKREEFSKIFPARIMDYLIANSQPFESEGGAVQGFYKFPPAERLPLIVAVRMSLSFPLLISAVPLYARDRTLTGEDAKKLQVCLFSDGGLSSNFPIHFFDQMLPNTPTFGISLDEYDSRRDRGAGNESYASADDAFGVPAGAGETRVWMPATASSGQLLPIQPLNGLVAFLERLITAAKDWQDNLQGTLAGYRDRIVHVYLKPEEGGLNLVMPPALIGALSEYGAQAGGMLRDKFNLDEHRWRRFLVAIDRLSDTLTNFVDSYRGTPNGPEPFEAFLARYPEHARSFRQTADRLKLLCGRAAKLAALGQAWGKELAIPADKLPHPKTDLRITPKP